MIFELSEPIFGDFVYMTQNCIVAVEKRPCWIYYRKYESMFAFRNTEMVQVIVILSLVGVLKYKGWFMTILVRNTVTATSYLCHCVTNLIPNLLVCSTPTCSGQHHKKHQGFALLVTDGTGQVVCKVFPCRNIRMTAYYNTEDTIMLMNP